MCKIIKDVPSCFEGCDFVLEFKEGKKKIKLLQLTDMQIIDSAQSRTTDRIRPDEVSAWRTENMDCQCGNYIRSLITQTSPDLIFITGDMIYGSFDDAGTTLEWFVALMDSFKIPWAPVFGNHDNESKRSVRWQCELLKNSKYCLFERGTVTGNSNYSIGIAVGNELRRVLYMIDSNGCRGGLEDAVIKEAGIYSDQRQLFVEKSKKIAAAQGRKIPAFAAFHIPVQEFSDAEESKGYTSEERKFYTIGVDVASKDGDFGFKVEARALKAGICGEHLNFFKECNVEAVFVGHCHSISTCILYQGIRWIYGLKTGQYDYHVPYALGGTLVTLFNDEFDVAYVPSLVEAKKMPGRAEMFNNIFAEE